MDPDSDEPCPMRDLRADYTEDEWRLAVDECENCFLNDPEYRELTTYGDLFRFGLDYLRRRDVGLSAPRKDLTHREEQIILLVHSEIEDRRSRRLQKERKQGQGQNRGPYLDDEE